MKITHYIKEYPRRAPKPCKLIAKDLDYGRAYVKFEDGAKEFVHSRYLVTINEFNQQNVSKILKGYKDARVKLNLKAPKLSPPFTGHVASMEYDGNDIFKEKITITQPKYPKWANWLAMDENGEWWVYQCKPEISFNVWVTSPPSNRKQKLPRIDSPAAPVAFWEKSLQRINWKPTHKVVDNGFVIDYIRNKQVIIVEECPTSKLCRVETENGDSSWIEKTQISNLDLLKEEFTKMVNYAHEFAEASVIALLEEPKGQILDENYIGPGYVIYSKGRLRSCKPAKEHINQGNAFYDRESAERESKRRELLVREKRAVMTDQQSVNHKKGYCYNTQADSFRSIIGSARNFATIAGAERFRESLTNEELDILYG